MMNYAKRSTVISNFQQESRNDIQQFVLNIYST